MIPAILVNGRYYGRTLPFLNMYCSASELVDPADREDGKADAYWLSESASFHGAAHPLLVDDRVGGTATFELQGMVSAAESHTHHYFLLTGYDAAEPAVWISAPRGSLQAREDPAGLTLSGGEWTLLLRDVSSHYRSIQQYKPGQERALLESLRRPGGGVAPVAALPTGPSDVAGQWIPTGSPGLFAQLADGRRTGRTALSDPSADPAVRLSQVLQASWLPPNVLARQYRLRIAGQEPWRVEAPVPPGRNWSPLSDALVALSVGQESTDPTAVELWPSVDGDGRPRIGARETVLGSWSTIDPRVEKVDVQGNGDLPARLMPSRSLSVECLVTDGRLILVAPLPPADLASLQDGADSLLVSGKLPDALRDSQAWHEVRQRLGACLQQAAGRLCWASHIRWEWVTAVALHTEQLQREERSRGLFGKKTLVSTTVAWLQIDIGMPDGTRRRLHVDEGRNEAVAMVEQRLGLVLDAVARAGVGAVSRDPEASGRQLMHGQATTARWAVTGTPGYSLPEGGLDCDG